MSDVPEGYKVSEVGVIPEDWDEHKLNDIVFDFRGGAPLAPNDFKDNGIKVLPKGGVTRGGFLVIENDKTQYCSSQYAEKHETNLVDSTYTIIVLRDLVPSGPNIGLMVKIDSNSNDKYILAQGVYGFKVNDALVSSNYLIHLSNGSEYRKLMNNIMVGSTQVHITNTAFLKLQIPLPSLSEQQAIASALSDTDALITALEQLITKKRNIKQGAMQQLLTGEKRLPGFSGEWGIVPLKNLIQVPVTDGPHLTPKFLQEGIPFLSVNNIVNNRISLSNLRYISKNDHDIFSRKCKPQKEDILLGKAASVGLVAVVDLDFDFNIWSPIALIRLSNQHIPKFIYYSFQSRYVINQIKLFTNSSSQGNIGMGDIEEIDFLVPSKEEQIAIAQILSDMDTEIEALEQKKAKYKAIKQGMMQELLTGKTRLV